MLHHKPTESPRCYGAPPSISLIQVQQLGKEEDVKET